MVVCVGCLVGLATPAFANSPEPELNAQGEQIRVGYARMLDALSKEIAGELPQLDSAKEAAFNDARAALAALKAPGADAAPQAHLAFQTQKTLTEAQALEAARAILAETDAFLASDKLDATLITVAILRHGTPAALAEFAQQGEAQQALLDKLFADKALMKQMVIAGGANGGEYGEAMQVYTAILEASERARKPGMLQRLALGTALHMPWIPGKDKGAVPGIVYRTQTRIDQVPRYLHYEKAYLNDELDPAFKDMTTWECRFITNSEYSNEELAWTREMIRNFRPDHITMPDYKWRYSRIVKSDVPYTSTRHDPKLGSPAQQAICLGGICGRRAFFGRLATRAFGIPTRASTQTGHAAMSRWTPDGWAINLGAWWSMAWCGPQGGLDFLLDSQAREFPEHYMQVLRAQWIGEALGEEDVSIRQYGKGGGVWNGLAFYKKRAVVEDNQAAAVEAELAALSADEARLLGESDNVLGDAEIKAIEIPEEDKKIVVAEDGTITVPAVVCTSPKNNTDKVAFLKSWDGGMQIHYQRLGNRPEILRYTVQAPTAGKYELTLNVCTVSKKYEVIARLNRRTLVNTMLPYTKGSWQRTEPEIIELRKGRNTIMLTFRAPNRGVSIKEFQLKPVEK
jgi:hypothetical protein